ncbi:MAG: rhodanese-like domain-containing protein [Bacteroidales bacterium]|nr:rhodanese-like domain-containing protein [Bacteroidales bacterium]
MIKNNIIWIGVVTFILGFSSCSNDKKEFKYSVPEAFEFAQNVKYLDIETVVDIILSYDTINYIFVDVREPHDYINGHIMNAINLPLKSLSGNNTKIFCQNDLIYLIYGYDGSQAAMVYTYLMQLGIKNVAPLGGGYDYIYNNIISSFNIKSATYDDEIAKYNFAKIVSETSGLGKADANGNSSSAPPPTIINVQQTDNVQSSGGCN